MSLEWEAVFSKNVHPYRDRHWLWQVFPELYPLPPGRTAQAFKCRAYACGKCRRCFDLDSISQCNHVPHYASSVDLTQPELRGLSVQFAPLTEPYVCVFDAGCGTGSSCFPLVEKNGQTVVTAVDFSENAIQQLKTRPYYDEQRVRADVGDILALSPDPQFDYVMANFVLSSVQDVRGALTTLSRQLKPQGTLLCLDYEGNDYRIQRREMRVCEYGSICERDDGTILIGFDVSKLVSCLKSIGLHVYEASEWEKEERNRKTGQHFVRKHFIIKAGWW